MQTEDTYELVIDLPESKFDQFQKKAWEEGFDEPEELLMCLINKFLRKKAENEEAVFEGDSFHYEIELIISYSRMLQFITEMLNQVLKTVESFKFSYNSHHKKLLLANYCNDTSSLGALLRAAKANFYDQLSISDLRIVFFWAITTYPNQKDLIRKTFPLMYSKS
jgi:hypothetical protein